MAIRKLKKLSTRLFPALVLLSGPWSPLYALNLLLGGGYDDNPYELSGSVDGAAYVDIDINHAGTRPVLKKSEIRYDASLAGRIYESDFHDADYYRMDLRGRFVNRFKIGERTANFLLTADWRSDRRNYFSQLLREIPVSRGASLADRFDYDDPKISAELIYRLNRVHSVSLYSYFSFRDYIEDYEDIDIEKLDFNEFSLQPTYRYKNANGFRARAFVYFRKRSYEDLLEDDVTGRNILNQKLRYKFYGYGVTATRIVSDSLSFNVYANGYFARDGAVGFRDFDFHQLRAGFEYKYSENNKVEAQASCYIRDFLLDVASPIESETGYAGRLRKGCKGEIIHTSPVMNIGKNQLQLLLKAGTEFESNSASNLSFDKKYASISFSYSF